MDGFVRASELGPGLSQEEEHQAQIKYLLDINLKLNEALDAKPQESGSMKPVEKEALIFIINELQTGLKLCNQELKQSNLANARHEATIKDLKKEVSEATQAIIEIREHFPALIASINKRVSKVEHPDKQPGQTAQDRAKKIDRYMEGRPDHKASYEALKGFLKIGDNALLSRAIDALNREFPGKYVMRKDKDDKRKRILAEVKRIG